MGNLVGVLSAAAHPISFHMPLSITLLSTTTHSHHLLSLACSTPLRLPLPSPRCSHLVSRALCPLSCSLSLPTMAASAAMARAASVASSPSVSSAPRVASARLSHAFFGKGLGFCPPAPQKIAARPVSVRAQEKYQVIEPLNGDPFVGGLETPITSSPLIAWYLSNLPAYRTAVSPLLRGVEVGLAHGFLLVGPFVKTGPLRNTEVAGIAGTFGAAGLVVILSVCLTIYGVAQFKEGTPSIAPSLTLTGRKKAADKLQTAEGWASFAGGFFFGGLSGVAWAYICLYVLNLPYFVK